MTGPRGYTVAAAHMGAGRIVLVYDDHATATEPTPLVLVAATFTDNDDGTYTVTPT